MEEKTSFYSKAQLNEFRKSIRAMGETVNNGTVVIPMGDASTKGKVLDRIRPEDILKTPINDKEAWRNIRIYFVIHCTKIA